MKNTNFEKKRSENGIQYLLYQKAEEEIRPLIPKRDIFLKPFQSLWNGRTKLSYPTKGLMHINAYLKQQDAAVREQTAEKIIQAVSRLDSGRKNCLDMEEIYADSMENIYFVCIPGVINNVDAENLESELWNLLEPGTADEEKTVRRQEDESALGLLFRSSNSSNSFTLKKDVSVLGKSKERADIVIQGSVSVSRRHCRIIRRQGTCYVEDLGSLNHTYKNGVLVEPGALVELHRGDRLKLSDIEFAIE